MVLPPTEYRAARNNKGHSASDVRLDFGAEDLGKLLDLPR